MGSLKLQPECRLPPTIERKRVWAGQQRIIWYKTHCFNVGFLKSGIGVVTQSPLKQSTKEMAVPFMACANVISFKIMYDKVQKTLSSQQIKVMKGGFAFVLVAQITGFLLNFYYQLFHKSEHETHKSGLTQGVKWDDIFWVIFTVST